MYPWYLWLLGAPLPDDHRKRVPEDTLARYCIYSERPPCFVADVRNTEMDTTDCHITMSFLRCRTFIHYPLSYSRPVRR